MNFFPASTGKATRYADRAVQEDARVALSVSSQKRILQIIPEYIPATVLQKKPGNVLQENEAMVKM